MTRIRRRQRRLDERRDGYRVVAGLALATALTLAQLFGLAVAMRQLVDRNKPTPASRAIRADWLDPLPLPAEPVPPEPVARDTDTASRKPPPSRAPASPLAPTIDRRAAGAAATRVPPASPLQLFNPDGSIAIPPAAAPPVPVAQRELGQRPRGAATRPRVLDYSPTPFESLWVPPDEDLGEEAIRRSTISHTWQLPGGSQIHCSATLVFGMLGGCGWGTPPRLPTDVLRRMRADPPLPHKKLATTPCTTTAAAPSASAAPPADETATHCEPATENAASGQRDSQPAAKSQAEPRGDAPRS